MAEKAVGKADNAAEVEVALAQKANERRSVSAATRKPFGSQQQKLSYPQREGYHRHWFNEEPGRIERAGEAGYNAVLDPTTRKPIRRPVGRNREGGLLMAQLMEIPIEWWTEDMKQIQDQIDELERGYASGEDAFGAPGKDGRYVPRQGITIRHGR